MGPLPELDVAMARAWPAAVVEERDGWVFRATGGLTRRANSVLAAGSPASLPEAIDGAERFAERHAIAPVFQVSEASTPPVVAAALEARCYGPTAQTTMLWGDGAQVADRLRRSSELTMEVSPRATDEWVTCYRGEHDPALRTAEAQALLLEHLLAPAHQAAFVTARDDASGVVAVGQVVVVDGWGCLQYLATRPDARRQGAAQAVMGQLVSETLHAGADRVLAAVMADNAASLSLCAKAGFERSHDYHYWTRA